MDRLNNTLAASQAKPAATNATLLALAERCEKATGPNRELDAEIAVAVRHFPANVGFVWKHSPKANSPETGAVECCTGLGTGGHWYRSKTYTASVDAARALVLEGWDFGLGNHDATTKAWAWVAEAEDARWEFWQTIQNRNAATPALALCAAALRARAASVGRNPQGEDPAEGLRAEHEHAVGAAETPKDTRHDQ